MAFRAGADAIGVNFCPESKRYVTQQAAAEIARSCAGLGWLVGVFVDAEPIQIVRAAEQLCLSAVQLHGHEPPEVLAQLRGLRVIRAMRVAAAQWNEMMQYLHRCGDVNAMPLAVLLDAAVPGALGGTGQTADWALARAYAQTPGLPPLVLAGGLNPENVAQAIHLVRPAAVDVASGIEYAPRQICPHKVVDFVEAAKSAFARLDHQPDPL